MSDRTLNCGIWFPYANIPSFSEVLKTFNMLSIKPSNWVNKFMNMIDCAMSIVYLALVNYVYTHADILNIWLYLSNIYILYNCS